MQRKKGSGYLEFLLSCPPHSTECVFRCGSSRLSILMGENRKQDARRVSSFCFYGLFAIGSIVGIVMLLFRAILQKEFKEPQVKMSTQ